MNYFNYTLSIDYIDAPFQESTSSKGILFVATLGFVLQGCMPLPPISGRSRARVDCEARRFVTLLTLWSFEFSRLFGTRNSKCFWVHCFSVQWYNFLQPIPWVVLLFHSISHLKRFGWWSLPLHDHANGFCLVFGPGWSEWDECQGIGNRVLPECACPSRWNAPLVFCFWKLDHVARMVREM